MTPTIEYVQQKIAEFNALIFSSSLPPIPVKLAKARTFLGKVQYRKNRSLFGTKSKNTDFLMRISTMYDLSEREQEDVIIHEMIHYFIAYKGIRDTSTHGKVFREMMDRINLEFGRNITVSHRLPHGIVAPQHQAPRQNHICVSFLHNGKLGITVCSESKVPALRRSLPRHYRIRQMVWYVSTDPYFNRFPRSRTPKIYKVDETELGEHLESTTTPTTRQ